MRSALLMLAMTTTLLAGGCSKYREAAEKAAAERAADASAIVASSTDAAVNEPTPKQRTNYHSAVFTMTKGVVDMCVDYDLTLIPEMDAGTAWLHSKDGPFHFLVEPVRKGDATELQTRCTEQFEDRTVLATCTIDSEKDRDGGFRSHMISAAHFYNYATLSTSDGDMKHCLEQKGKWKAVSRDSDEWRSAKLEQSRKALQRVLAQPSGSE